jgi:asparagine synthase (glutamine-hydrolysing)
MCGISGFIDFQRISNEIILQSMTEALSHRGPEDGGYSIFQINNAIVGLGHRRLAIIDISPSGHQPMTFKHLNIVFNGEIYNYKEIRSELIHFGYSFSTESDTEVILKAFDKWGEEALAKFIGMFAFVIYNTKNETVSLFRDRVGVKPLFYYFNNGLFLFASELKSFHKHPSFKKNIDLNNLAHFLNRGYFPTPLSVFEHTFKLLPGHYLVFNINKRSISLKKYWDIFDYYNAPKLKLNSFEAINELERLLISSCEFRMVSDVPVGVFLSGGFDSSLITAILQKNSIEKLNTFTIGFNEAGFDESKNAKSIAKFIGTNHNEYFCTQQDALDIFPQLPYIYDEPFGDFSGIPTTLVSRFAKTIVKVVNTGDGAEEVFAGYSIYLNDYKINSNILKIGKGILFPLNIAVSLLPRKELPFYASYLKKLNNIVGIGQKQSFSYKHFLLNQKINSKHSYFDDFNLLNEKNTYSSQLLAIDFKTRLLDDFLVKVDRATMSSGLEAREPLLDHRIVEFMAQIPSEMKCKGGITKHLLKEVAYRYVPRELLDRPKMGFSIPIDSWLRSNLREYTEYYLSESRIKQEGLFSPKAVRKLKEKFLDKSISYEESRNFKLILCYEMWKEIWL